MNKAQTTIFAILGLVIIILAGLAIFITQKTKVDNPVINVDKEIEPLKQAIEECMALSGKAAIVKAGMQGGYVSTGRLKPDLVSPTKGDAFYLSPPSIADPTRGIIIPYWSYFAGETCLGDCVPGSMRLPLKRKAKGDASVESQLDSFVLQDTPACIQEEMALFAEKGYAITPQGKMEYVSTIAETDVTIDLTYPLTIFLNDKTYTMSRYRTTLDIPLKKFYDTAERILFTVGATDAQYFEKLTIESIAPFAISKESELPPLAGMTEPGGAEKMWTQMAVKGKIRDIMADTVGNVQVLGAREVSIPIVLDNTYQKAMYDQYLINLPPEDDEETFDVSNSIISFTYLPWWDLYVKVRPSQGALIRPGKFKTSFPIPMEFKKYEFQYDIAYPVLIQIRDPDAFLGEGYTFQFGYEVNIRSSQPLTADVHEITIPEDNAFQFCDEKNRKSGDITIFTKDVDTNGYVHDVFLSFACVFEICELGNSALVNNKAAYTAKLPLCMDGRIIPEKEEYFGLSRILSSKKDRADSREVFVEKYKDVHVYVKKELVTPTLTADSEERTSWEFRPGRGAFFLDQDETAIITFNRIPALGEDDYSQTVMLNWTETEKVIKLISGSYTVDATIVKELGPGRSVEKIVFPSKEVCGGGFLGIGDTCSTVGPIEFNETLILGTISFNEDYPLNISKENFSQNLTVFIPAFDFPKITTIDDADALDLAHITVRSDTPAEAWPAWGSPLFPRANTPSQ